MNVYIHVSECICLEKYPIEIQHIQLVYINRYRCVYVVV